MPVDNRARPRRSIAKRKAPDGFVNTEEAVEASYDSELDRDDDHGDDDAKPKAKRFCQPLIPPASPVSPGLSYTSLSTSTMSLEPDLNLTQQQTDTWSPGLSVQTLPKTLSLTFNVPKGHNGPFVVNLNLADLVENNAQVSIPPFKKRRLEPSSPKRKAPRTPKGKLRPFVFTNLPEDIRNMVYRQLFIGKKTLDFNHPDFSLSAQFLRTCRVVFSEGTAILYGKNRFVLKRDYSVGGPIWSKPWYEMGFRNIRTWLHTIGPEMVSLLRSLRIHFEDGSVSHTAPRSHIPLLRNPRENTRYVHDGELLECLKILVKYSALRELVLIFSSNRALSARDDRFLAVLRQLKTDNIHVQDGEGLPWHHCRFHRSAIAPDVERHLEKAMQRKPRLYGSKKVDLITEYFYHI